MKPEAVQDFIMAFTQDEGIELPYFVNDEKFQGPPDSYSRYAASHAAMLNEIEREDQNRNESQLTPGSGAESEELPANVAGRLGQLDENAVVKTEGETAT